MWSDLLLLKKKKKKKPNNGLDLVTRCHALQIPNKILIHKSWTLIKLLKKRKEKERLVML